MRRSCLLVVLLLTGACGGGEKKVPVAPGNTPTDSGVTYVDPAVDAGVDAGPDLLAPVVTFVSPQPVSDPNADTVFTESTISVRCRAKIGTGTGAAAVDKTSIKITLDPPDDTGKQVVAAVNATSNDEYEGTFELTNRLNGRLRFHCSAQDTGTKVRTGSAVLDTLLDLGPSIEVKEPSSKVYALKSRVPIEFMVTPSLLADGDKEQTVHEVKLAISGVDVPVEQSPVTPGLYQTSVDFDDRVRFPVPPTSAQISISATNERTPTVATRQVKLDIVVDGDGPVIKVDEPKDGEIVHGTKTLTVDVSDPAGVRVSSLVADFNQGSLILREWKGTAPKLSTTFDTGVFGTVLTQLTINITAADTVGNETTASLRLKLDNVPPRLSLDPAPGVEISKAGFCSAGFNLVGDDTPNDLDVVSNSSRYRLLIEDDTNHPLTDTNLTTFYYQAGLNTSSVRLFMQRDLSVPLLIDKDKDAAHLCDEINNDEMDLPKAMHPVTLALSQVTPDAGYAWYPKKDPVVDSCYDPNGSATNTAKTICDKPADAYMVRVVAGRSADHPPAIYAIRPANACNAEYAGESWELLDIAREGWICLAARAEDNKGNIGISPPLRICWDDPRTGSVPGCVADRSNPPSCTDGCVFSDEQRRYAQPSAWERP